MVMVFFCINLYTKAYKQLRENDMKVYLFKDLIESINGDNLNDSQVITEVANIDQLPHGLIKIDGRFAVARCLMADELVCVREKSLFIEWIDDSLADYERIHEDAVNCPHCGYTLRDSFMLIDGDEVECPNCRSEFIVSVHTEVTYSTEITKRNTEVLDLITKK